jgi:tetratricopeptide (TPR) repeat protein
MHRENWKLSADEGRSFLERGQLKNAIAAFDEARRHLVTKTEEPHHNISLVEIEMRIAMIAQYRGDATQAETLLRDVTERESRINQSSMSVQDAITWGRIMKEVHRWLAASLISQGQVSEAIRELQGVVGSTPEYWNDVTSFEAKRDLAVAYGRRGSVTEAQRIIHLLDALCEEHKDRRRSLPVGGPARQNNGGSSHVLLHRKTQSEPSAPGFTSRPDEVDSAFSSATDEELLRLEGKHNTLKLAGAVVDNLAGNYVKALDHATEVLAILKRHRGGWHIKTLEAASLRTWLLARTSRLREAEEECMQTRQTLTREFGAGHPKTLEITGILVFIFRKQRRLVEAVDTCTSLCQMAEMAPTLEHHPLILAHKAELARCHRAAGQYQAAERLLRDVIQRSKHLQSSQHEREVDTPDGLLFEAELARVSCASGNLEYAQRCALGVLRRQRKLFASAAANTDPKSRVDDKTGAEPATLGEKPNSALIDEVLDDITFELALDDKIRRWDVGHSWSKASLPGSRFLGAEALVVSTALQDRIDDIDAQIAQFFNDKGMAAVDLALLEGQPSRRRELAAQLRCKLSVLTLHPSIFYTLRVLASIQWQLELEDATLTQPRRMLALVWRWQANPDILGPDDPSTLTTEYEYAVVRRELGHNDAARRCFRRVFVARARVLGESHPDTLSAKRELVVTSCLMTRWKHPDSELDSAALAADPKPLKTDGYVSDADSPCATSGTEVDMGIEQWDDAELCSRDIFRLHQFHLGKEHPETLKSLVWVFSIQLLLKKDDSVHETCALLLAVLQSPKVTRARLVDALQMQERIAQLYRDFDYLQQSANVLRGILQVFKSPAGSQGREPSGLAALKGRVSELQKELQQRDPRLHDFFAHISNSKVSA